LSNDAYDQEKTGANLSEESTEVQLITTSSNQRKKTKYQVNVLPLRSLRGGQPTRLDTTLKSKVASRYSVQVDKITVLVQSTTVLIALL
jgi:hypothetical protein